MRAAFTIFEIVLALAIIGVIVGLAWPVMIRFSGEQALRRNTEEVRALLAETRRLAMQSGLVFQFRYEPEGQRCLALPYERPLSNAEIDTQSTLDASEPPIENRAILLELGDGHRLLASPPGAAAFMQPQLAERLSEDLLTMFGAPAKLTEVAWAAPILFSPDGTAQDATLVVADERGRYQVVSIRGLTAAVRVGPIDRERER